MVSTVVTSLRIRWFFDLSNIWSGWTEQMLAGTHDWSLVLLTKPPGHTWLTVRSGADKLSGQIDGVFDRFLCHITVVQVLCAQHGTSSTVSGCRHWWCELIWSLRIVGKSAGLVIFVCWLLCGICSTPMLPQWHVKDPRHSAKSADGRLHLNRLTSLTQWSRSGLSMPLSRLREWTYPETSSHATCQGTFSHSHLSSVSHWTDPGIKGGIASVCKLISTSKEKKKCRQGMNGQTFSPKFSQARKKPPPPPLFFTWQ